MSMIAVRRSTSEDSAPLAASPRRERLQIHLDYSPLDAQRRVGLEVLCDLLGMRVSFECAGAPDIYCGMDSGIGSTAAIWITPEPWPMLAPARIDVIDDCPIMLRRLRPDALIRGDRVQFDIALSAHYWLSLMSEQELTRDEHGRVPSAIHPARAHCGSQPPIHRYAEMLAARLHSCGWHSEVPRWPSDKTWAVAFTHDVDDPERELGLFELLRRTAKASHTLKEAYWSTRQHLDWTSLRRQVLKPERCSEWDFGEFIQAEKASGIQSAFYFGVNKAGRNHPLDIKYDISVRRYRKLIEQLANEGCEIGLHAAYETSRGRPPIADQLDRLRRECETPVSGVRYHYLQLDSIDPMYTLSRAADSGLAYDTTIGFNDLPGFRAGIAAPYLPPCLRKWQQRPFVELPMTLADMHLPRDDQTEAVRMVTEHLETVRSLGGLAVLNWHVGHWHSDPGWRAGYLAACAFVRADRQVWRATPAQIADWWIWRRTATQHN